MTFTLHSRWESLEQLISAHPQGLRLDLGCGYAKPEGFIGLDNLVGKGVQEEDQDRAPDIFMDINQDTLPFESSSCVEVRASHFLEHSNLDHVISETFRVLVPRGQFIFAVPYANSAEGMFPGHSLFLTEKWFHLNRNFQDKFLIINEVYDKSDEYKRLPFLVRLLLPFDRARIFLFNACRQMTITATPRK